MGYYLDEGDTDLLTNVREHADVAAGQGRDVYFTGEEGTEQPAQDKNYKFSYYPKEGVPPGQKPSDDELDFFEKRKTFLGRAKEQIGFDPDTMNPDEEAYRVANEALKNASPVVRLFGPQTPEDYRKLRNVFEEARKKATEQKNYGRKVLGDLDTMFRKNYDEERKHQRTLEETAAKEAGKVPTQEVEMTRIALYDPDPEKRKQAQGVLDAMQGRKLKLEREKKMVEREGIEIQSLSQAVADGQDAPIAIKNTRGANIHAIVKSEVLKKYPKFDMNMADANYKWKQSSTNQRTINFVGGALPRLGALDDQLKKMPNVDLNIINSVMAVTSKEFGKPEYTNYEANRNAIVQEINTALSGTSQSSDTRLEIELENLKSSRSPAQIKGAIENLRMALEARLDVDLSPLYPIEVVRGEKTLGRYKSELYKQYRGDYSPHFGQSATGKQERTVVERRKTASGKILTKYSDGSIE